MARYTQSVALIILWTLLLSTIAARAQGPPPTWPPVSSEELNLKDEPSHPGATAILLNRDERVDDVKSFETVYLRIKILKDEGKSYADVQIPYYARGGTIEDIRARTVRPDGTVVEFGGQVFDTVVAKSKRLKVQAKTFTLPAVETGSIIEYSYRYTWRADFPDYLKDPSGFIINRSFSVPSVHWVLQHELYTRHALFSVRPLPKASFRWASVRLPPGVLVQSMTDGTFQLEVGNLPPLEKEQFMPPEDVLNSRVHFYYMIGSAGAYWDDQVKAGAESVNAFVSHDKGIERVVHQTVAPTDPPEVKLRKLYEWVQHLRYVSFEPTRTEKEQKQDNIRSNKNVSDVLNRGYAMSNEANYLFLALVRAAGMNASMVRVTDRRTGYFDRTVLDERQLDAMVVMVRLGEKQLFFDPATRFCPYGIVPWGVTGIQGLGLEIPAQNLFVHVDGLSSEFAVTTRTAELKLDREGNVDGKLEVSFNSQEALSHRLNSYDEDEVGRKQDLEDEIKRWLPASASLTVESISNWESSDDLRVQCHLKIPHYALQTSHRMLFAPAVFQSNRINPFQHARRVYPVNFPHAYREVDKVEFLLPVGYRVEAAPATQADQSRFSRFQETFQSRPGVLQFERNFSLDGFYFPTDLYTQVRSVFNATAASDGELVVLQNEMGSSH